MPSRAGVLHTLKQFAPSNRAWPAWATAAALVAVLWAAGFAFAPALDANFTDWDDNVYVTENPLVQHLSWDTAGRHFVTFVSGNYHPITMLTYAVEHALGGLDPQVFHATNLALHLLNTALCFLFFRRLGSTPVAALAGCLLFAVHPLRVEPVAWVTGRKDLLSTAFFLLASWAYLGYRENGSGRYYGASLLAFALALLSKATAVTLPAALLLYDYLARRPMDRRAWLEKVPFGALAFAAGIVALAARDSFQGVLQESSPAGWGDVLQAAHRIVYYCLARTVLPATTLFAPYPGQRDAGTWATALEGLALPALILLVALAACTAWRTRKIPFATGFFLATLAPSLTVPVLGYSADRFAYLPSVGLGYLAGEAFFWAQRHRPQDTTYRRALWFLLLAIASILTLLSRQRCAAWMDSIALWTDAVAVYSAAGAGPGNTALAYAYRGRARREAGDPAGALMDTAKALQLAPRSPEAHLEQGATLAALGRPQEALESFSKAIEARPAQAAAYAQRGSVRFLLGDLSGAIADFDQALAANPFDGAAHNERGIAQATGGNYREAIADFTRAIELAPPGETALFNRGNVRLSAGDYAGAATDFTRTIELDASNAGAFYGRSLARERLGDPAGAEQDLSHTRALGYPPSVPAADVPTNPPRAKER